MILYGYLASLLYGGLCLALGLLLYKLGMNKKYTRKLVHILVGFEWVILHHFMGNSIHFLVVCLLFTGLLFISHVGHLMPMISSEGENSSGTVYYGVSMSVMALVSLFIPEMMLPFGAAVMITSFGDGSSGIFGQLIKKKNPRIFGNKTLIGTLAGFFASFASLYLFALAYEMPLKLYEMLMVALLAALLELMTGKGLDNLSVPFGSLLLIYAFLYFPAVENYLCPILLTPIVILVASAKNVLTRGGIVCAVIVDIVISVSFGNFGFLALLAFLVLGVLSDKVKSAGTKKKSECRTYFQVLANSAPAAICSLFYCIRPNPIMLVAFLASMGEALADTLASGIGARDKHVFDLFRMKKCEVGVSGGMSVLGTVSAAFGASLMMLLGYLFDLLTVPQLAIGALAAFLGCIFDSFLGSWVQGKYRCEKCGAMTEREMHCSEKTTLVRGLRTVDNDMVNLFSNIFAAVVSIAAYFLFL